MNYRTVIFIICLCCLIIVPVFAEVNLVPNASFETSGGWTFAESEVVIDNKAPHSGSACIKVENDGSKNISLASEWIHFPCKSPRRIIVRAWAKAEDLQPGGQNWKAARLNIWVRDEKGQKIKMSYSSHPGLIGEFGSYSAGTFGWKEFTGNFVLPAGTDSFIFTAGSSYARGTVWFDDFSAVEVPLMWQPREDSSALFSLNFKNPKPKPVIGVGWNWEFVWGQPTELGAKDQYIDQILGFSSWDEQSFVRFGYKAEFALNKNMPEWAAAAPQLYKKVLKGLQEQGKTVLACNWSYGRTPANLTPPYPADEFAGAVAEALKGWLLDDKFTCIDYVSLWNEPCWSYKGKYPDDFIIYNKAFDAALRQAGIRDKVKLLATDTTESGYAAWLNFPKYDSLLNDCADAYGAHDYGASVEAPEPEERGGYLQSFLEGYQKAALALGDKPLMISEMGCGAGDDEAAFHGLLGNCELVLGGLNAGVRAFARWAYNTPGGYCPFNEEEGVVTPKPSSYYGYSILTKAVRPESKVVPINLLSGGMDSEGYTRVHCAALTGPDGRIVVLIINDGLRSKKVSLKGLPDRTFYHYWYDSTLPDGIQQGRTLVPGDTTVEVHACSINALVTWKWDSLKPFYGSIAVMPDTRTQAGTVTLKLAARSLSGKVTHVRLSSDDGEWSSWLAFSSTRNWRVADGAKRVNAQFRDSERNLSPVCSD